VQFGAICPARKDSVQRDRKSVFRGRMKLHRSLHSDGVREL
jgi:hypothetical protein